jgi:thioesterase domain-containing protein
VYKEVRFAGANVYQDQKLTEQIEFPDVYRQSNLTRLQVLYWIAQMLRSEVPFLNTVLTFMIDGPIDSVLFENAFEALLRESDALRTVIDEVNGLPQGRVLTTTDSALQHLDFSEHTNPLAAARTWIDEQSTTPLKLTERLFDSALIRISSEQFIWYLNQHHIIADASSFFLIFSRLAKLYESSLAPELTKETALPAYADYLAYERTYRESPQYSKAEAYWHRKLTPGPEPIRFFGRIPAKKTTIVKRVSYDLGAERSEKLRELARSEGIFTVSEELSLYNLLLTLFFILLHQISGNRRLGIVTPVHNRFTERFKNTIGLIMEICALQVELSVDDSFNSFLKKVKRETRETMLHYQYASGLSLDNKAFDVMFNVYITPALTINGVDVHADRIHPGHGSESLSLHVNDVRDSGHILLHFDFHQDVFDNEEYELAVQLFVRLVDAILVNTLQPVESLSATLIRFESDNAKEGKAQLTSPNSSELLDRTAREIVAPRDLLEGQLIRIWEEILNVAPVGITDNFFDLGGNSWLAVLMLGRIESLTGRYFPLNLLLRATNVTELADILRTEMVSDLWSTLFTIQDGNGRPPLFCVPGAGGNGLAISRIAHHLHEDQPVQMFQIPLVEGGKVPFSRIEEMAAHYLSALQSVQPHGPYYLAGYSAGGVVAFELAQQLQKRGEVVALLAIIDVPAQSQRYRYLYKMARFFASLLNLEGDADVRLFIRSRDGLFRLKYYQWRGMWDSLWRQRGWLVRFLGIIRGFWPIPGRLRTRVTNEPTTRSNSPDSRAHIHSVEEGDRQWRLEDRWMREYFDVNNRAVKLYFPQRYRGRIVLFRSSEGYDRLDMRSDDPHLGWGRIATDGVDTHIIPGNHRQIVREPSVQELGQRLQLYLDMAQRNRTREHAANDSTN